MPLVPAGSSLARQTMRAAYEDLERAILPTNADDFRKLSLEDVQKVALELEQQLAARQSLRNMRRLIPLLNGLGHFAKLLEPFCAGTPFRQGLWAPIALVLRDASEHLEAFEQIIRGYSEIAASMKRFEHLRNAFQRDAGFQESLATIYSDILRFHKHTYVFVHRSCKP